MRQFIVSICDSNIACILGLNMFILFGILSIVLLLYSNVILALRNFIILQKASISNEGATSGQDTDKLSVEEETFKTMQFEIARSCGCGLMNIFTKIGMWGKSLLATSFDLKTSIFLLISLFLTIMAFIIHENNADILIFVDVLWVFIDESVFPICATIILCIRLVLAPIIPLWNFIWRFVIQIILGTFTIIIKCEVADIALFLKNIFEMISHFFSTCLNWKPFQSPELDLTATFQNLHHILLFPKKILKNACGEAHLLTIWDYIFFCIPLCR